MGNGQEEFESFRRESWHLSKAVPLSVIAFLVFQTIALVIWGTRLDSRVGFLEKGKIDHEQTDKDKQSEQDHRLSALESILPKMAVIEARQNDVIKRLDDNGAKLDRILTDVNRGK